MESKAFSAIIDAPVLEELLEPELIDKCEAKSTLKLRHKLNSTPLLVASLESGPGFAVAKRAT